MSSFRFVFSWGEDSVEVDSVTSFEYVNSVEVEYFNSVEYVKFDVSISVVVDIGVDIIVHLVVIGEQPSNSDCVAFKS